MTQRTKTPKPIIRSTKCSLKFSNTSKRQSITHFIEEYKRVTQCFIDILWENRKQSIPSLLPKDITQQVNTWLTARAIQAAAKQASGIVRGTVKKHKKRLFVLKKLMKEGKSPKKLQRVIAKTVLSKPELKSVNPELDSRFIEVIKSSNSFDLWVKISSLGNKLKFYVPIKKSKHFNELTEQGFSLKKGVRLSSHDITFNMEKPKPLPKTQGDILGIDIGIINSWTASNKTVSKSCPHGHNLQTIQKKLSRRKKDSRGFAKAQTHRTNYANWSLNQLNLSKVKSIRIENIKHLRCHKRSSRYMSHWTYSELFSKLESLCQEQGVLVDKVDPTYTSQRCSQCGWTQKSNRRGKIFKCKKCSCTLDADLNASFNIALPLPSISKEDRLKRINKTGFYWLVEGQEHIVPGVQKTELPYYFVK